jgi:hypothetical protein
VGQFDRRPAGSWWRTEDPASAARSPVSVHSGTPPGFVVWKAAAPPGLMPGAESPLFIATLIELVKRVGVPATLPAQNTHGDDAITRMPGVGWAKDSHSSYGLAAHQGGEPLPQVGDLVEMLVLGGVTGQLPQFFGGAAGAEGAGGVQGFVSDGGGLERVAGGHRETGHLGPAEHPGAGVDSGCRRESVGGLPGVAAQNRQVDQSQSGELGVTRCATTL